GGWGGDCCGVTSSGGVDGGGGVGWLMRVAEWGCFDGGVGGGVVLVVVVAATVAAGSRWRWWRRVRESDIDDRIDRSEGNNFGFAGKSPPEKFSGGGSVVADGGLAGGGKEDGV
nr:hypothetical protein [Tanacetum cinerariifolium]